MILGVGNDFGDLNDDATATAFVTGVHQDLPGLVAWVGRTQNDPKVAKLK